MLRFRNVLICLLICAGVAVGSRSVLDGVSGRSRPDERTPELIFDEGDLSIGTVLAGESVRRQLHVKNTSDAPVTLSHFEKSCSCLGISPDRNVEFLPGESKVFSIDLMADATNSKIDPDRGITPGSTVLTAVYSGPALQGQKSNATIQYSILTDAVFDPPVVNVGRVSQRATATGTTTIRLYAPAKSLRVLPHPDWIVRIDDIGGGRFSLTVSASRTRPIRKLDDSLFFVAVNEDGSERSRRSLPITGEILDDLHADPAQILLGRVEVGKAREESFRIASRTKRPFTVQRVECGSSEVTISALEGDGRAFLVKVIPVELSERERTIQIRVVDDRGVESTIMTSLRYFGVAGAK